MTGVLTTGVGRLRLTGDNAGFCEAILRKHNTAAPLRLESLRHVRPREDAAAEQTQQQPLVVNLLMQLRAYYDQNNTFLRSQAALNLQLTNQLRQVLSTSNGAVRARAGEIERAIRSNLYREGEFSRAMGQLTQELKKNENRPPERTVDASRSGPAFRTSGRPTARTGSGAVSGDRSQTPSALRAFASQETGRETTPVIQPTATVRTPAVPAGERLQYRQEQTPPQVTGNAEAKSGKKYQQSAVSQPQPEAAEQPVRQKKQSKQSHPPQKQPEQRIQPQAQPVKPVQPEKQPGQPTQQQVQPAKPIPPQKQSEQLIQRQTQLEKPTQSQKQPEQPTQRQSQPEKPVQPKKQPEQPVQPQAQAEKNVLSPKQSEGPTQWQERAEQPVRQTERAETPVRQQKPEPVLQPETAPIQMAPQPERDNRAGSVVSVDHAEPSRISMELSQSSNLETAYRQTSEMQEESGQPVMEYQQQPVRAVLVSSATQSAPWTLPGKWPNASAAEVFWGHQSAAWTNWGRSDWHGSTGLPTTLPGNAQPLRYRSAVDHTAASPEASTQSRQSSTGAVPANIVQSVQYRNILQQAGLLPGILTQYRQPSTRAVPTSIVQPVQYQKILQQARALPGIPMQYQQPSMGAVPARIVQSVQYRNILQQAGLLPGIPMQNRQPSTGAVPASIVQPVQYRNILQQAGMLPGAPMQNRQPSTGAVPASIVQPVQYRNILQQAGMLPGVPMQYRQLSTGAVPGSIVQPIQYRNILQQAGMLPGVPMQNRQPSTGAVPARIVQSVQYRNILQQAGMLPGTPIQYRQPSTGAVPASIVKTVQYRNILQPAGVFSNPRIQNRETAAAAIFHPTVGGIANRQSGMYGQTLPMLHGVQSGLPQHSGKGMPLIRRAANGEQSGGLLTEGVAAATEELYGAARILSGTAPNGRLSVRQNESDLETVQGRHVAAPTGTDVPFHGLRQLIGRTLRGTEPVQAPELRRAMEVLTNGSIPKPGGTASWSLRRFRTAAAASGSKPSGRAAGMPTAGATLVSLTPEAISQETGPVWRPETATPHPTAAQPGATVIHRRPQKPEVPAAPMPVEESSGEEVLKAQTVDAAQVAAMNAAFSYGAEPSRPHSAAAPVITPEQEERIAGRVLEELNYNRMAAEVLDRVERRLRAERRKIGR